MHNDTAGRGRGYRDGYGAEGEERPARRGRKGDVAAGGGLQDIGPQREGVMCLETKGEHGQWAVGELRIGETRKSQWAVEEARAFTGKQGQGIAVPGGVAAGGDTAKERFYDGPAWGEGRGRRREAEGKRKRSGWRGLERRRILKRGCRTGESRSD
jgi:hypothetical protein